MRYELTTDESVALRERVTRFLTMDTGTSSYAETDISDRLTTRSFGAPVLNNLIIMARPAWQDLRTIMICAGDRKNCCLVSVGFTRAIYRNVDVEFVLAAVVEYLLSPKTRWFRFKFWVRTVIPSKWEDYKTQKWLKQNANQDKETVA